MENRSEDGITDEKAKKEKTLQTSKPVQESQKDEAVWWRRTREREMTKNLVLNKGHRCRIHTEGNIIRCQVECREKRKYRRKTNK